MTRCGDFSTKKAKILGYFFVNFQRFRLFTVKLLKFRLCLPNSDVSNFSKLFGYLLLDNLVVLPATLCTQVCKFVQKMAGGVLVTNSIFRIFNQFFGDLSSPIVRKSGGAVKSKQKTDETKRDDSKSSMNS